MKFSELVRLLEENGFSMIREIRLGRERVEND
jgi:hypothetical protein